MSEFTTKRHLKRGEIDSIEVLAQRLDAGDLVAGTVIHGVNLSGFDHWRDRRMDDVIFLGCQFDSVAQQHHVRLQGGDIFPAFENLPYQPYRTTLYSVDELFDGYDEQGYARTRDFQIYTHFDKARRKGYGVSIKETLAQSLHDHAINDALAELLAQRVDNGVVGVMGGHGTPRTDAYYRKVARMCWALSREGYFIASGGGPGIMEAANLGAWLANYANPMVIDAALNVLASAPTFNGGYKEGTPAYLNAIDDYIQHARRVIAKFGVDATDEITSKFARECDKPGDSLAVPTWFYGHEPTNLFGNHVAKYFSNSLREDGLLAISIGGVIYAPGSAGTYQEIFMDLAQNHYATFDFRSPMVFLGQEAFGPIYQFIQSFVAQRDMSGVYGHLLGLFDDPWDVVEFIKKHPPERKPHKQPLYELV